MRHGIEQELQIVNSANFELCAGHVDDLAQAVRPRADSLNVFADFGRDFYDTQLEYWIGIFDSPFQLRDMLRVFRREVAEKARDMGLRVMACGVNPLITTKRPGEVFGEHHHVGVRTAREAINLHNLLRLFIPELIAFSANSPFYAGKREPFESYRLHRSAHCRCPPHLTQRDMMKLRWCSHSFSGVPERMWDVTPFAKGGRCTVEVRLFDAQPRCERSMAIAAVLQALAAKLITDEVDLDALVDPQSAWMDELKRNREEAIRSGIRSRLSLSTRPVLPLVDDMPAIEALNELQAWLYDELDIFGDDGESAVIDIVESEICLCEEERDSRDHCDATEYAGEMVRLTMEAE
ncbi:MAG: hypothetical protein JJU29_01850 [Verrucomicrobia bacterium]|nr:hypothetical protein [Verrucomicrobiota bacterium]MCH8510976.1 hypothetical protein [Kiritimatiellia bacterium]